MLALFVCAVGFALAAEVIGIIKSFSSKDPEPKWSSICSGYVWLKRTVYYKSIRPANGLS